MSLLLGALPVFGQTLQVSSASGEPGGDVTLEISLNGPAGSTPVALKWETIFPAQVLNVDGSDPKVGRAASDSGKSLTCTKRSIYAYICILAGGQKPVPSGTVATLHFKIQANANPGTALVRIERAEAVTADVRKLTLNDTQGTVTIH